MSVIVNGMEMPKSCYHCPFVRDVNGSVICPVERLVIEDSLEERSSFCPLGEVSDDGVVVSEDEFQYYSRAMLVALTLRDLLVGLNSFAEVPKSIEPIANAPADNKAEE